MAASPPQPSQQMMCPLLTRADAPAPSRVVAIGVPTAPPASHEFTAVSCVGPACAWFMAEQREDGQVSGRCAVSVLPMAIIDHTAKREEGMKRAEASDQESAEKLEADRVERNTFMNNILESLQRSEAATERRFAEFQAVLDEQRRQLMMLNARGTKPPEKA